jgi:hypothetical protein
MPITASHWTIATNGDIRYTGPNHTTAGSSYATVIEFHRWLQDRADDAVADAATSDLLDITDTTPSERQTDNIVKLLSPYNIDQTASEHLYDGSIIQNGENDIWDGLVVIANPGMPLQIHQNGAVISAVNSFWNSQNNGATYAGLNYDTANGISHRFMIKVRTSGTDVDGRRLIGQTREFGKSYSEFKINGTARGNNVLALNYVTDNNNQTASGTVAGYTGITLTTAGYNSLDIDSVGGVEYYYAKWNANKPTNSINQFYERMKYLTRQTETTTLFGLPGEQFRGITHEVSLTTPRSGTFSAFEKVTWGTGGTAGEGQMLAIDSTTAGTKMWIQLLKGVAPSASVTITGSGSSATATNTGTPTERALSFPFCGQSTGSALLGAYGLTIETDDATSADRITALDGTTRNPPNNQTFYVNGVVSGEDYVLVGPKDTGDDILYAQFTVATSALTAANITSVVVSSAIPGDTPTSGTIRVLDNAGVYRRLVYTSFAGSTFTIDPTASEAVVANVADFNVTNASIGNNVFISYIDRLANATTASYSATYTSDRALWVRVRDGGGTPIKTFQSAATFGSAGGTSTVIRTSDT